jgi:hypothetical protein
MTFGGSNFVVYSADQASARDLKEKYDATSDWFSYFNSVEARSLAMDGEFNDQLASNAYQSGNFASAKASEQTAVDKLQAAVVAEVAFDKVWESQDLVSDNADIQTTLADANMYDGEGAYYDAQGAYYDAQAARINALAKAEEGALKAANSRERSYGTFVILIGVFLIIVAVAFLLLAIGKFLVWRGPTHHEHT